MVNLLSKDYIWPIQESGATDLDTIPHYPEFSKRWPSSIVTLQAQHGPYEIVISIIKAGGSAYGNMFKKARWR